MAPPSGSPWVLIKWQTLGLTQTHGIRISGTVLGGLFLALSMHFCSLANICQGFFSGRRYGGLGIHGQLAWRVWEAGDVWGAYFENQGS